MSKEIATEIGRKVTKRSKDAAKHLKTKIIIPDEEKMQLSEFEKLKKYYRIPWFLLLDSILLICVLIMVRKKKKMIFKKKKSSLFIVIQEILILKILVNLQLVIFFQKVFFQIKKVKTFIINIIFIRYKKHMMI